jgi:hypothetical protein
MVELVMVSACVVANPGRIGRITHRAWGAWGERPTRIQFEPERQPPEITNT